MAEDNAVTRAEIVAKKQFDAASLVMEDDAAAEIEIFDPRTKSGTGIFITVYSRDSERARAVTRGQLNRRFRNMGRARGAAALTAEELEAETMDLLVACTKSWRGVVWNGNELALTAEHARGLYTASPIIREQVEDAISDRANFTRR
ncbi:MAG TPA: hypothetical protein VFN64_03860 [Burkholderiaceae bacterium]|nr:hypothetical protein [Burkholderiaceae bacterium]